MNRILFLICLWLAFLDGLEGRVGGMALPGRDASIHAYEGRDVVERGQGAGVSEDAVSVARGRMTGHEMPLPKGNFRAVIRNSVGWIDTSANPAPISGPFPPHSKTPLHA